MFIAPTQFLCLSKSCFYLMRLCNSWLTLPTSLRYPRVSGLYLVYALVHSICPNGSSQVLWDVTALPDSDSVLVSYRLCPHFSLFRSCCRYACVLSSALFGHCRFRRMYDMCLLNLIAAYLLLIYGRSSRPGYTTKQQHGCSPPHRSWDTSNSVPVSDPGESAAIDRRGRIE